MRRKRLIIIGIVDAIIFAAILLPLSAPEVKSGVTVPDGMAEIVLRAARTHFDSSLQRLLAFRYEIVVREQTETYDYYRVDGKTFFGVTVHRADVFSDNGIAIVPSLRDDVVLSTVDPATSINAANEKEFIAPIDRASERVTEKPFGIYVTPATSPVQPERFTGWHAGTDFEILAGEEDSDVPMYAVCSGGVRVRKFVSGYGGVLIQDCRIAGESVTVLYGHLNLDSILPEEGDAVAQGQFIGNLGQGNTAQTDGERKHLHLSIHKGTNIEYKGYVSSESDLGAWLDPEEMLL